MTQKLDVVLKTADFFGVLLLDGEARHFWIVC